MNRILLLAVTGWLAAGAQAQTPPTAAPHTLWVSGGLGGATFLSGASEGAFAGLATINFGFGASLLTLRTGTVGELFGSSAWDGSVLYGHAFRGRYTRTTVSAGVGVAGGCHANSPTLLGGTCDVVPTGLAFPLQLSASLLPLHTVGIGIVAFADVSRHLSFAGAAVDLEIGKLR